MLISGDQLGSLLSTLYDDVLFVAERYGTCFGFVWEWEALTYGGDMDLWTVVGLRVQSKSFEKRGTYFLYFWCN